MHFSSRRAFLRQANSLGDHINCQESGSVKSSLALGPEYRFHLSFYRLGLYLRERTARPPYGMEGDPRQKTRCLRYSIRSRSDRGWPGCSASLADDSQTASRMIAKLSVAPKTRAISTHVYEIRPQADNNAVDLISNALPFGPLWYAEPNAVHNAIKNAKQITATHTML